MKHLLDFIVESNIRNIFEATADQINYAANNEGIHEIGGKCGWWTTAEKFNDWLFGETKRAKNTLKNIFKNEYTDEQIKEAIKACYDVCISKYGNELTNVTVPFVIFTDSTNRFAIRTNVNNEIDIKSIFKKILGKLPESLDETHTGFGTSAVKGLAFEPILVDALIKFISASKNKEVKNAEELDLPENIFNCCKKIDELYDIVNIYKDVDDEQLSNLIKTTGTGKTGRQQDIKIINQDTFDIIKDEDIDNLLKNSGRIISDVTCFDPKEPNDKTKAKIYISCKIGKAQLSGITNNSVFYKNGKRLKSNELFSMNLNKEDKLLTPLKGLCKLLDMNFDTVFSFYSDLGNHIDNVNKREHIDYDNDIYTMPNTTNIETSDDLKRLLLCIIGSNYCYVNGDHPEKIVKLDFSKNTLQKVKIKFIGNAGISNSGRTIKRYADINGQKCFFSFRQSLEGHRYPYRLFIGDLDVYKFIESLK